MLFILRMADCVMVYIYSKCSCSHGEVWNNRDNLYSLCPSILLQNGACSPSDVRRTNTFTIMMFSTIPATEVIVAAEKTAVICIFHLLRFVLILLFNFYILYEQWCFTPQPPSVTFLMLLNFFLLHVSNPLFLQRQNWAKKHKEWKTAFKPWLWMTEPQLIMEP